MRYQKSTLCLIMTLSPRMVSRNICLWTNIKYFCLTTYFLRDQVLGIVDLREALTQSIYKHMNKLSKQVTRRGPWQSGWIKEAFLEKQNITCLKSRGQILMIII